VQWNLIDPARVPQISAARDNFEKASDAYLIALRELEASERQPVISASASG
jgi:OMF family outer membrane factor